MIWREWHIIGRFDSVAYLLPADSMRSTAVATGQLEAEAKRGRVFRVAAVHAAGWAVIEVADARMNPA